MAQEVRTRPQKHSNAAIMVNLFQLFCLLFLPILISGCGHVISKDLRGQIDPALTFRKVFEDPNAYKGKTVLWGGEIIQTMNQKDGTTSIEVFQTPLGWRGEPKDSKESVISEGRFLIHVDRYIDPYLYRRGRKITVAGEIQGEMTKTLDEMSYRYPVVMSKQIYLWEEYRKDYPSQYYYYDPWWDYPYPYYYVVPRVRHRHDHDR